MMMKQVVLTSETHSNQLVTTFSDLFKHNTLTDVTIVCHDRVKIEAHRIVLCAGSSLFKEFFISNSQTHPILYLKGIKQSQLMPIMEFLYIGETTILQDNINEFLSVARELEVLGLEETLDKDEDIVQKIEKQSNSSNSPKIPTSYEYNQSNFSGKTKESREKQIELVHSVEVTIEEDSKSSVFENTGIDLLSEKSNKAAAQNPRKSYQCKSGKFEGRTEKSPQEHMAIAHPTSNATKCKMCPFIGLTIEDLKKHNMSTHPSHEATRNLNHACDQCPFKTFKTSALNIHKLLKHANPSKIMNMNNVPQKPSNI